MHFLFLLHNLTPAPSVAKLVIFLIAELLLTKNASLLNWLINKYSIFAFIFLFDIQIQNSSEIVLFPAITIFNDTKLFLDFLDFPQKKANGIGKCKKIKQFCDKIDLNLALGQVTSCWGCHTAWWRPACCWLGLGSMSIGDPSASH